MLLEELGLDEVEDAGGGDQEELLEVDELEDDGGGQEELLELDELDDDGGGDQELLELDDEDDEELRHVVQVVPVQKLPAPPLHKSFFAVALSEVLNTAISSITPSNSPLVDPACRPR